MSDLLGSVRVRFNAVVDELQILAFIPRDTALQLDALRRGEDFARTLARMKRGARAKQLEGVANELLAMELALSTVRHQVQMCVSLKSDAPEDAWGHLVRAQLACASAITVRRQVAPDADVTGLANLLGLLHSIEHWVFPPQAFCSVGGLARRRGCSVCGGDYDHCAHIKGRAYMGELCLAIIKEIELEEVSRVDNPANKLARLTHFSDSGGLRNKMTWRLEPHAQ